MSAFMLGYTAAQRGGKWWHNPFPAGSSLAYEWDKGHTRRRVHGGLPVQGHTP